MQKILWVFSHIFESHYECDHRYEEIIKMGGLETFFGALNHENPFIIKIVIMEILSHLTYENERQYIIFMVKNPFYMEKLISLIQSDVKYLFLINYNSFLKKGKRSRCFVI